MRGSRLAELLFDPDEGPIVWFLGVAVIVLAFFGGLYLVAQGVGDSMAEICAAEGGHYEYKTTWNDGNRESQTEACTPG